MPRVRQPNPDDLLDGLWTQSAEIDTFIDDRERVDSVRVLGRIYSRTSGNFKAVGWEVEIGVVDGKGDLQFIRVLLHDDVANHRVQSDLRFWT